MAKVKARRFYRGGKGAAGLAALALVALLSAHAFGHARLTRSVPAQNAELSVIPRAVCLWFSEPVEKAFSRFEVKDAEGNRVDDEEAWKASENSRGTGAEVVLPLKPIGPGTYTVQWDVLSVDTHKLKGEFQFTVLPGAEAGDAGSEDVGQTGCAVPIS